MLYLRNARYLEDLPGNSGFDLYEGHLAVEEGPAGAVRRVSRIPSIAEQAPGDRVIDCSGKLIARALSCGHHHIYSALARGMPPAPRVPSSFVDVLELVWWRLDKCLDKDMITASALSTALHLAKSGVAFCIDHHASPFELGGSLSLIADAFNRVGIGHLLCYETSCRDGEAIALAGIAENERYLASGGKGHVGLHASFTVSDEVLAASVEVARKYGTGIHIHVAEAKSDQDHCLATYGKTVVQRLKDAGALDLRQTILGHCVHLSDEDRAILASSPCWVVQNAESNMNNNVGRAGYGYTERAMLGTDGMHSDMLRSAQAAYFSAIEVEGTGPAQIYARLRNVHKHSALHGACGDSANNLMILDYDSPTPVTADNALGHWFYGLDARNVHTVVSQGNVIVENGKLASADEEEILAFSREQALRLWKKLS